MRPSPRHQFSCTVAANPDEDRDSVYIFGGGASGGQLFNDTFVLDVCTCPTHTHARGVLPEAKGGMRAPP